MQQTELNGVYEIRYKDISRAPVQNWRALLPWIWPVFAAPAAYLLGLLFALFPTSIEILYSRFLYQFQTIESLVFGFAPFSAGEIIIPPAIAGMLVWFIIRLIRVKRYPARFVACALGIMSVVSVCGARFTLAWGLNYHRATIAQMLRLDIRERPVEELADLMARLATDANNYRYLLPEDDYGIFDPGTDAEILQAATDACMALGARFAPFDRPFPKAKPLLSSALFSRMGISGVYNPLMSEANVNVAEPKLLLSSHACHELAHMAGFAREDEANFLAFLASRYSSDLHVRYSGTVMALIHVENALFARDEELYYEVRELYYDRLERDLKDHYDYWHSQEGPVRDAIEEVNDAYLKSQGEESGIDSYGEMVDLLLAFYDMR